MSEHGKNHWIKLYVEMNHDPKIGLLTDDVKWRFVSVLLLAGELNQDGFLPETNDMAWQLRTNPETLAAQMRTLAGRGLVELRVDPDGDERWYVSKFAQRQAPSTNAERQKQWRKRNTNNEPVTKRYANVTPEAETETETETETEGEGEHPRATAARVPVVITQVPDRTPGGAQASESYRPPPDAPIPEDDEPGMVRAAPAAVRVIWRITGNWPPADLHDWLAEQMGDAPDEAAFRRVYLAWRARGYKATNYEGIVEWYRQAMSAPNWQPPAQGRPVTSASGSAPLSRSEEAAAAYAAAKRAVLGGTS